MKSIFYKELRELLPWIPLGLFLLSVLCWFAAPRDARLFQSVELTIVGGIGVGCVVVALVFGFLQSIPDSRTEAKGYLLHRPVSLTKIFWGKLLAGGTAYAICLLPPLFILACYLEYQGPQQLPTNARQLLPTVLLSIAFFAANPAAIWTVHREANWVGSKCFPVVFSFVAMFVSYLLVNPPFWWSPIALGASVGITQGVIVAAAHHAFCTEQFSPSASDTNRTSRLANMGVLLVTFTGVMFVITTGHTLLRHSLRADSAPPRTYAVAFSKNGEIWEFSEQASGPYHLAPTYHLSGRRIVDPPDSSAALRPLPPDWTECVKANFYTHDFSAAWPAQFQQVIWISIGNVSHNLFEHRGQVYEYAQTGGLRSIITPLGVFAPNEVAKGRFVGLTVVYSRSGFSGQYAGTSTPSLLGLPLLSDENGVYQVDVQAREIRTIIDGPVDRVALVLPRSDQDCILWTVHETKLRRHSVRATDPDVQLSFADSDNVIKARRYELPAVDAELTGEWEIAPINATERESLSVAETQDHTTAVIRHKYLANQPSATFNIYDSNQTLQRSGAVTLHTPPTMGEPIPLLPPASLITTLIPNNNAPLSRPVQIGLIVHAVVAVVLAFGVGLLRGLSLQSRVAWCCIAAAVGISAPLAMFFSYPKLIREKCSKCDRLRRIDLPTCELCGSSWPRVPLDGTEIIGVRPTRSALADAARP